MKKSRNPQIQLIKFVGTRQNILHAVWKNNSNQLDCFCYCFAWVGFGRDPNTNDTRSQVKYNDLFISYCHLYDNYLYLATYLTCLYRMLHESTFSSLVSLANNKNSFCAKWVFKSLSNSEFHCRNLVVFRDISWLQVQLSYSNWIVTDFCSFSSFLVVIQFTQYDSLDSVLRKVFLRSLWMSGQHMFA